MTLTYVVIFGGILALLALYGLFVMISQNRRGFNFDYDDPNLVWKEIQRDANTQSLERQLANAQQTISTTISSQTFGGAIPSLPKTLTQTAPTKPKLSMVVQPIFFGIVAIVGGAIAAGYAYFNWIEFQDSENWPTVSGDIVETGIIEEYDSEDSEYSYEPTITYEYTVDGESYRSDRIRFFSKSYDSRAEAQEVINKHQQASPLEVRYNPDNPEKAILDRETDEQLLVGLGIGGGIAVIVGLAAIVFGAFRGLRAASSI